jgi:hypothetical protein
VLLYEVVFEEERLVFVRGEDPFDVVDARDEVSGLDVLFALKYDESLFLRLFALPT